MPYVVVPSGQATQDALEAPPGAPLKLPRGHGVHTCAPTTAEKVPAAQGRHCVAPALGAAEPGEHSAQAEAAKAPAAALARPTGHATQPSSVCPGAGL